MRTGVIVLVLVCLLSLALAVSGQDVRENVLRSVVSVTAEVPPDARTARSLGPERAGSGVVIDSSGLILTIGYLILEAMHIQVVDPSGRAVPADLVGYDHPTGFGLIRAKRPLAGRAIGFGSTQ